MCRNLRGYFGSGSRCRLGVPLSPSAKPTMSARAQQSVEFGYLLQEVGDKVVSESELNAYEASFFGDSDSEVLSWQPSEFLDPEVFELVDEEVAEVEEMVKATAAEQGGADVVVLSADTLALQVEWLETKAQLLADSLAALSVPTAIETATDTPELARFPQALGLGGTGLWADAKPLDKMVPWEHLGAPPPVGVRPASGATTMTCLLEKKAVVGWPEKLLELRTPDQERKPEVEVRLLTNGVKGQLVLGAKESSSQSSEVAKLVVAVDVKKGKIAMGARAKGVSLTHLAAAGQVDPLKLGKFHETHLEVNQKIGELEQVKNKKEA